MLDQSETKTCRGTGAKSRVRFLEKDIIICNRYLYTNIKGVKTRLVENQFEKPNIHRSKQSKMNYEAEETEETRVHDSFARITTRSDEQDSKPIKFPDDENNVFLDSMSNITTRIDSSELGIETRVIDRNFIDTTDLSNPLNEELPIRKYLTVELSSRSELVANPGYHHRLTFDVTNSHVLRIRHYLTPTSNPFPVYYGVRPFVDIGPGQTVQVTVDVIIPPNVAETVNKVTLRVEGIEVVEKSVNFYIRSSISRIYDDRRPEIDYYFNNNCNGKTIGDSCLKSYWSVDVLVQDLDTGLKSVNSLPKGLYPRTPYVSGTSSPVKFYYANNCCNRYVEVTAVDASGNVYSRRIDVDSWWNLTTGEILAVIFIILFIVLLIVLIVISIIYCIKRRKSHDLPYSQRYGSRASPQ